MEPSDDFIPNTLVIMNGTFPHPIVPCAPCHAYPNRDSRFRNSFLTCTVHRVQIDHNSQTPIERYRSCVNGCQRWNGSFWRTYVKRSHRTLVIAILQDRRDIRSDPFYGTLDMAHF